jgi:hypothetical protein
MPIITKRAYNDLLNESYSAGYGAGFNRGLTEGLKTNRPNSLCCKAGAEAGAIRWNPYNYVVQCHSCGHVYDMKEASAE